MNQINYYLLDLKEHQHRVDKIHGMTVHHWPIEPLVTAQRKKKYMISNMIQSNTEITNERSMESKITLSKRTIHNNL